MTVRAETDSPEVRAFYGRDHIDLSNQARSIGVKKGLALIIPPALEVYRATEGLQPGQIYTAEVMTVRRGGDDVWIERFKRRVGSTQNDSEKGLTVYTKNEINEQNILVNPHGLSEPLRVRWVEGNPVKRAFGAIRRLLSS